MSRRPLAVIFLLAAAWVAAYAMLWRTAPESRDPAASDSTRSDPATHGTTPGAREAAADIAPQISPEIAARFERVVAGMWWHRPRYAALELRAEQVAELDALCLAMLRRRFRLRQIMRAEEPAWRDAVEGLDLDLAADRLETLGEQAAELATIEERFVLEALALLERSQLEKLGRDHPGLLERPWFRTLGRDGKAGRRHGGPGDASEKPRSRGAS